MGRPETTSEALEWLGHQRDQLQSDCYYDEAKTFTHCLALLRRHLEPQWTRTQPTDVGDFWWQPEDLQYPPAFMRLVWDESWNEGERIILVDRDTGMPLAGGMGGWWTPAVVPQPPLPAPANQERGT